MLNKPELHQTLHYNSSYVIFVLHSFSHGFEGKITVESMDKFNDDKVSGKCQLKLFNRY